MRLKPCASVAASASLRDTRTRNDRLVVDRLSNLPDELLIRILSLLPTKDAAATCMLSNRLRRVLPRITSLDFDSSPISFCLGSPYRIEQFPCFVTFVDTVLRTHQSQYLTRFRLGVGVDFAEERYYGCNPYRDGCPKACYPDLKYSLITAWISFPLTRCGLRELDLCIPLKEPGADIQLPPEIFTCQSLEVLKLHVDLRLDQASTMPSFHLPNLKLLYLNVYFIPNDEFLPRLISSCPILEDLKVEAYWNQVHYINISSPSLRRLRFHVLKCDIRHNTDFVLIHTPNLEYLDYDDELPLQYSISNMECLVEAHIHPIPLPEFRGVTCEVARQQMLTLVRCLSNVQHLDLSGISTKELNFVGVMDQLPVFHNLKYLELRYSSTRWDQVLLAFLECSPVLETLAFPWGMVSKPPFDDNPDTCELERELCSTTLASIPSCCRYYLKRILIKLGTGNEREIDLIQFLLRHALILEELVISLSPRDAIVDRLVLESILQNLPRASITCSIQVQAQD